MVHEKVDGSGAAVTWLDVPDLPDGTSRERLQSAGRDRSASEGTVGESMRQLSTTDMHTVRKCSTICSINVVPSTPSSGSPMSAAMSASSLFAGQLGGKRHSERPSGFNAMNANEKLQVLQYENQDLSDHVASLEGKLRQKVREVEVLQEKVTEHEMHLQVFEQKLDEAHMGRFIPREGARRALTESQKEIAGALALARQQSREQEDENYEIREQLAEMEEDLEASKAENGSLLAELGTSEQLSAKLREEVAEERARRLETEQTVENEREILREARDELCCLQEELQDMRFRAADGRVVYGHQQSVAALKSKDPRRNRKLVTHNLLSQMDGLGESDTEDESMATVSEANDAEDSGPCNAQMDEPEDEEAACREAELTQTINELRQRLRMMEKMAGHWKRRANETWWQRISGHCCAARPTDSRASSVSNVSMAGTGSSARKIASPPLQLKFQAAAPR